MKNLLILVGVLSLLVFATACSKQEEPAAPAEEMSATEASATDMEQAVKETMDDATAAVGEAADETMEAGQEMVKEGQARLEETAEEVMEDGQEMLDETTESAASMMDDAKQALDKEMPAKK